MFTLFKLFIKFVFFIIFLAISLVVAGNFQIIRSSSGVHVLQREKWGFSNFYVNTTNWNALDFAKNPHISTEIFKDRFQALFSDTKKDVQSWWKGVTNDSNVPELKTIKKEFDNAVSSLNKAYQNGSVSMEKYKKKLKKLQKETEEAVQKVLKAMKED